MMDFSRNATYGCLSTTLVVEVYLIFTHVSYVILKTNYYVPNLLKDDQKLRRYRHVAYLSRTLYLFCITIWSSVEVCWHIWGDIDTSNFGHCVLFYLVPFTYLFISVLCRLFFSWARSVLIKYPINLSHMWDSILLCFNLCFFLAMFIYFLNQFHGDLDEYACQTKLDSNIVICCAVSYVVYELLSFLLFYMPLKEAGRYFDSSPNEYANPFLTTNQQLDDIETGQDEMEDDQCAVLLECPSEGSIKSRAQITQNCLGLIQEFHKSVKRNFLAGVLIIIIGSFQSALYFICFGCVESVDVVIIHGTNMGFRNTFLTLTIIILGLIRYVCMMLTESNWQRAFIPFCCWRSKSW